MHCVKCGTKLPDNARFCTNCGEKVSSSQGSPIYSDAQEKETVLAGDMETKIYMNPINDKNIEMDNQTEPAVHIGTEFENEVVVNQPYANEPVVNQPYGNEPVVNQPYGNAPMGEQPYVNNPTGNQPYGSASYGNEPVEDKGLSIASMIAGIVSLVFFCCMPGFNAIPAVAGLVLGIIGRNKGGKGMALAGIITSSIALALCLVALIGCIGLAVTGYSSYSYF